MIPLPALAAAVPAWVWKVAAAVVFAVFMFVGGCMHGKQGAEQKLAVVEASFRTAARLAAEQARVEEKHEKAIVERENSRNEKAIVANAATYVVELERLRKSAADPGRGPRSVPEPAAAPGDCPRASSAPASAELLGHGETLARILQSAVADRAALEACIAAWPRDRMP
jgi:hypothetical protein